MKRFGTFLAVLFLWIPACSNDAGTGSANNGAAGADIGDDATSTDDAGNSNSTSGDGGNDNNEPNDGGNNAGSDGGNNSVADTGGDDTGSAGGDTGLDADSVSADASADMPIFDVGPDASLCPNGVCDPDEDIVTCPQDCTDNFPECADGIDNDGDGLIDFRPSPNQGDPECDGPTDDDESA